MTSRTSSGLDELREALRQEWRADAACVGARMPDGSPAEFVDCTSAETAEYLIRRFCHACTVVGHCRVEGERQAPHAWSSVFGGRLWLKGQRP